MCPPTSGKYGGPTEQVGTLTVLGFHDSQKFDHTCTPMSHETISKAKLKSMHNCSLIEQAKARLIVQPVHGAVHKTEYTVRPPSYEYTVRPPKVHISTTKVQLADCAANP